ncbi:YggT family protein [Occultella aeris]|uniref:YGGT family protein n=2 Tax=Occultella TaxID=2828348 RepID=A0A7M4DPZ5_9MICO|nr:MULTISPECIES: YggT family protein [Occultella]MBZ2199259.1 YggT family protein [Occultella gossypii]VZO39539.1 YGGT family protein [Occultella aeris]
MAWVVGVVYLLLLLFLIFMLVRVVLDWVIQFARDWKPTGVMLVVAEVVYTITDPPLKALRRLIPPLRLGGFAIDLAFLVLIIVVSVLMAVLRPLTPA